MAEVTTTPAASPSPEGTASAVTASSHGIDVPGVHGEPLGEHQTSTGLSNEKLGMWVFLGSECLRFGGLIFTDLLYRGRAA
ncbi:hypothetical protein BH24ACT3_BH24ACT3_02150 [soil metagenome]